MIPPGSEEKCKQEEHPYLIVEQNKSLTIPINNKSNSLGYDGARHHRDV